MYNADLEILHGSCSVCTKRVFSWKSPIRDLCHTYRLCQVILIHCLLFFYSCLRNYEISFKQPQPFHNIILCDICKHTGTQKCDRWIFTFNCGKAVRLVGLDDKNQEKTLCIKVEVKFKETQQLRSFPSLLGLFSDQLNVQIPTIRWTFDEGPPLKGPPSFK